jgi:hypothetical protein
MESRVLGRMSSVATTSRVLGRMSSVATTNRVLGRMSRMPTAATMVLGELTLMSVDLVIDLTRE